MEDDVYLACDCCNRESKLFAELKLKFAGISVSGEAPRKSLRLLLEPIDSAKLTEEERAKPGTEAQEWVSAVACPFCGEVLRESGTEEPPPVVRATKDFAIKLTSPGWIAICGAESLLHAMENLKRSYPALVIARDVVSCKEVSEDELNSLWDHPGASHIYAW